MRKKLTTKTIDALPPAEGKRYEVRDELFTGLHIRVSSNGKKVWYLATCVDGRSCRIKLGSYPILSLSDARAKAQAILRDIQTGQSFKNEETKVAVVKTLGEIIPVFIERHAKRHTKDWKGTQSVLLRMRKLHDKAIDQIKRADVVYALEEIISDIEERGGKGTRANRGLAAIKKLYSWCIDQGIVDTSPVLSLKPPVREISRERWLTDDEVKAFWQGADEESYPFNQFAKLLLLSGQRLREIADMRWSELDLEQGTLTLKGSRTKNGTTHVIPLSASMLEILRNMPRFLGSNYVFTTTGNTPISGFGRLKKRLEVKVGLDANNWRFHDLRRTVATNLAMRGVQPHIIEAVLNHKTGIVSGIAAVYNRHAYMNEKREALEAWSLHLIELMSREPHADRNQKQVLCFA